MATELFAWGYTAWRSQRPDGYEVVGYVDGEEIHVTLDTPDDAERQFCYIARRAWARRKLGNIGALPACERQLKSSADTYYDVSFGRMFVNEQR